jgi:D-lactate dehydrogenase
MINKSTLRIIKPNFIIVNTGRGALIDTKEALAALTDEKLGGLALDVYEQEEGIFFSDNSTHNYKMIPCRDFTHSLMFF